MKKLLVLIVLLISVSSFAGEVVDSSEKQGVVDCKYLVSTDPVQVDAPVAIQSSNIKGTKVISE